MNDIFESPLLDPVTNLFELFLTHQSVIAPILLLTLEESGIPLFVPGDIIIAYSGYNISRGRISFPIALTVIMISILVGSSILFWLSSRYGNTIIVKFGRFLHLHPERLLKVEKQFKKYGPLVIIFGRHIPGFRIPITVFAGMSGIKYRAFIISTFISTLFWVIFYLELGMKLGRKIHAFSKVVSHGTALVFIVGAVIAGIFIFRRHFKK